MNHESELREALNYLFAHDLCAGGDLSKACSGPVFSRVQHRYRKVAGYVLEGLREGKSGVELRQHVGRQCRSLNPLVWWTLIKIAFEVIPILVEWWRNRK